VKRSLGLLAFLIIISTLATFARVEAAQSTGIHLVNSPTSVVAGSNNPIPVTVTVYYNGTTPGYELVVGILDMGLTPQRIVPGIVTSSTIACVNQPEPAALCAITTPAASGAESIDFQIGGIFGGKHAPGGWNLNVTAVLYDTQGRIVPGSVSSALFEIMLTPVALNVDVPSQVPVSVDGVQQSPGPTTVGVALGQHNITVPQFVQLTASTRLRFTQWSDGYPTTLRNIVVANNSSYQAQYVTQNLLTLVGVGQNITGTGWYDANTNGTFSATQTQPLNGTLGAVGGRSVFQGWYENGQLITNQPNGTILMDKPHTLTAVWQTDYSVPGIIVLAIAAAAIVILLVARRRKAVPRRTKTRRTRRRRS
jgi:hypothetical protein